MRKRKKYSDVSQYDPKIHTKTKGGLGFGMKKGSKEVKGETSGLHLCKVFGWDVPEHLKPLARKLKIIQ
jgi:hypothetical protein